MLDIDMFLPFDSYIPSFFQLFCFFTTLFVIAVFYYIGTIFSGPNSIIECRIVTGWGVTVFALILLGSGFQISLKNAAIILIFTGLVGTIKKWRLLQTSFPTNIFRIFCLGIPLALIAAAMIPTQWDDMSQWLPNARFLHEHNSFPNRFLPESPSVLPGYPYGLPIVVYLVSLISGSLAENAGQIFNLLLWLTFGVAIIRFTREINTLNNSRDTYCDKIKFDWYVCALAALIVVPFNPTWVTRLTFSNYSDVGTSVTLGVIVGILWLSSGKFANGSVAEAQTLGWQAGLAGCALIGLRQTNIILLALVVIGVLLVISLERSANRRQIVKFLARVTVLPLITWACWRWHVETQIGGGEFLLAPTQDWNITEIPRILSQMLVVASNKGGYFALMTAAVGISIFSIGKLKSDLRRISIITAVLFLGFNAFLMFTYVAAFNREDALRVASYWRYNTQLGGVCLLFLIFVVQKLLKKIQYPKYFISEWVKTILIIVVLITPILSAKKLRFDIDPQYNFAKKIGQELKTLLGEKDRLLLASPNTDGQYLVITRYRMHKSARVPLLSTSWNKHGEAELEKLIKEHNINCVWIRGVSEPFKKVFSHKLQKNKASLVRLDATGWSVERQWAIP